MVKGFSTKKIKVEKTLGEIFAKAREGKKITLLEAEIETKVRAKYLKAIEESAWNLLPQDIYLRGFILAYAKFLRLDTKKMIELYENESMIFANDIKNKNKLSYNQSVHEQKVLITPKILAYFGLSFFVLSMFSYIIFQVLKFAGNPNLEVTSPQNNIVVETDAADLAGITDVDNIVVVNNETIPVGNDGHFLLKLKLHSGVNIINIKAINKAKKETSEIFTVEYKPKTASIENNLNQ